MFEFEDVASISRICLYIRAFYRLLEIGCYKLVSESWSVLSRPKPVDFPVVCDMYGSTVGTCFAVAFF